MEEVNSSVPMEKTSKILRRSIFTFLQNYHYFTISAAIFAFPFAASSLLAQAFIPSSSLLWLIENRLTGLFAAAGFPSSSEFITILNIKLSQTISSSLLVFPFVFSFLLFSKALTIQVLSNQKPSSGIEIRSVFSVHKSLFITQACNLLVLLSANGTCFFVLFFVFNSFEAFGVLNPILVLVLSVAGAVLYSMILAYSLTICNLALSLSGMENSGGYIAILKACVLIKGRTSTALSLVLFMNMCLASIEALFHYRIVRAYILSDDIEFSPDFYMCLEGIFIAYLYAIILVLETIVGCSFYKSCKTAWEIENQEVRYCYGIEPKVKDSYYAWDSSKLSEDIP